MVPYSHLKSSLTQRLHTGFSLSHLTLFFLTYVRIWEAQWHMTLTGKRYSHGLLLTDEIWLKALEGF